MLAVYQTGVQYHFYHSLGLIIVGLVLLHIPKSKPVQLSGWLMLGGIVLFSVSLYALSITGIRILGVMDCIIFCKSLCVKYYRNSYFGCNYPLWWRSIFKCVVTTCLRCKEYEIIQLLLCQY